MRTKSDLRSAFLFGVVFSFCLFSSAVFDQAEAQEEKMGFNLGQVIVTATKTKHTLGDVPVAAEVITKEEIREKNIKTVQDALEYLAGVKINRDCGSWGNKGNVEIQGLEAMHTLILIDGQKIYGGHNAVDLQAFSTEMVERIEVIKGPASALYGSDAIGGVVNIITKPAPEKPAFSISTGFGSHGTQVHELSGGFSKGKFGTFLNYTHRESEGIQKRTDQYWEDVFQGTFQYAFTPESKLTLKPYYSEHRMKDEGRKQERFGLNSIWKWAPDELSELNLRGSLFNYKHYTADRSSDWETDSYETEINYSRSIMGRHILTGGYQYHKEKIDDNGKDYKADQVTNSFFIQDELNFKPLTFVLGARVDDHSEWGSKVNPKASILYEPIENLKFRTSVGTAFRGPHLVKLYADNWRMGPFLVHANPDLEPEESIGYQLGAEYKFSKKVLGKLSFFRNEIKDLITYRVVKPFPWPPFDMYWENVGEATTQGIELNLTNQMMKNLRGKLGYTYLDTEDKETGKELAYKPKDKLTLEFNWKFPKIDFNINLAGKYIGKRYNSDYEELGDYTIVDLALTKDITKYSQVFARVDNIFNKKVEDEYGIDGTGFFGGLRIKF